MFQNSPIATHADAPLIEYLLITRPTILVHDDRIFPGRIKVGRLHHPAIQLHTLCGEGEEFLRAQSIVREFLHQFLIVYQCLQHLTTVLAEHILHRMIQVTPRIDEVFKIATKNGIVHTSLLRQHLSLAIGMSHHHLLVCRAAGIGSKVYITRLFIETIDMLHHILVFHNLTKQLAVQIIEIQMIIAVTLAGQENMLFSNLDLLERFFLHILVHLVLDSELTDGRQRIGHIDPQHILMAIECEDGNLRGITGGLDTRDIAICIQWQLDTPRLVRLDVETVHADLRVHLTRHRILIRIVPGIFSIVRHLRRQPLIQLQGVLLHVRLIIAYPDNLFRVGREHHRRVCGELLLIYPVRDAIEHLVELSVLCHLTLCVVIEQLHQPDIVVSDESDLIAIWRKNWCLLWSAIAQRGKFVVPDVIDIVDGSKRTTIDGLRLRLDEDPSTVRTHDVVVHPVHLSPSGCGCIEEHALLHACPEGITDNLLPVGTNL